MSDRTAIWRYVLDAGALIAHEKGNPKVGALLKVASRQRIEMILPSAVLAQVWRDGSRQVVLSRMLNTPGIIEAPLRHDDAKRVGELLRRSGTSDVVDAHVVVLAGRLKASVITSDPDDITALNPDLPLIAV